ncbi:MAG: TlpA disulfide reductase family protein [Planctomycetota bacterium]
MRAAPVTTQPGTEWFSARIKQYEGLLEQVRLYQTLYPGGQYQVPVVSIELETLYELGTLRGGAFTTFCRRIDAHLQGRKADDPVLWEAAYWKIICRRLQSPATTQATSAPVQRLDDGLAVAQREYIESYPRSPHVPFLAAALFEHALRTDNMEMLRWLVATLKSSFPKHQITAELANRLNREQAIGQKINLSIKLADGQSLETREFIGRPVMIVLWESTSVATHECLRQVVKLCLEHPEIQPVGINLDDSVDRMKSCCAELGVDWPQSYDGLGRAGEFARQWSVKQVPLVFVIDRRGVLVGVAGREEWAALVLEVLERRSP